MNIERDRLVSKLIADAFTDLNTSTLAIEHKSNLTAMMPGWINSKVNEMIYFGIPLGQIEVKIISMIKGMIQSMDNSYKNNTFMPN
jgi:hypothetical protein